MPAHRVPTATLARRGAFKKDPQRARARANEPRPNGPIGEPPACLTPSQIKCWKEIIESAPEGVLTRADRFIVELAARLLALWRGRNAPPAWVGTQLRTCLASMGMTPSDRSRVGAGAPAPEASAWDAIDRPS